MAFGMLALGALAWPDAGHAASWNLNANGNWNVAGNWTPAGFPNAVDATATLGSVITANRTITLGQNIRLGTLAIDSLSNYTVRNNRLNFDVSAGSAALTVTNLNGNGSHTIASRVVLNDALVVSQGSSGRLTISGRISGAGSLTQQGAGTLILTGNNSYSGGTAVSAGTLQGNTTSLKGSIVNNAAVVFNQTGNGTYAGVMTGTGSLTKLGGGRLTLTGANKHSGGTTVSAGRLRVNATSLPGDVVNNARLEFNQTSDGTFAGVISGSGLVTKLGGGTLTLSGANSYSGGTTVSGGALRGDATSLQGNIVNNTVVGFDQGVAGTYAGAMSGTGALVKLGAGTLTMSGASTLTSGTSVVAGGLQLLGSLASNVAVAPGAALGGTGTITGAVTTGAGSVVAPGAPFGTLTVNGTYAHDAGAVFRVRTDASGASSRLNVAGAATLAGGTVEVLAEDGSYAPSTQYTILRAGSVTGTFSAVSSNLAFLTPSLSHGPNDVLLTLVRNATPFPAVAWTANQRQVSAYLQRNEDAGGDLGTIITTFEGLSGDGARSALDSLSGDLHPSLWSVALRSTPQQDAVMARLRALQAASAAQTSETLADAEPRPVADTTPPVASAASDEALPLALDPQLGSWLEVLGQSGRLEGDGNGPTTNFQDVGFLAGHDVRIGENAVIGASVGYDQTSSMLAPDRARANVAAYRAGVHGGYRAGPIRARGIAAFAYDRFDTQRQITVGALSRVADAGYGGSQLQSAGEIGYALGSERVEIEPFAGVGYSQLWTQSFSERGAGAAGIEAQAASGTSLQSSLGVRVGTTVVTPGGTALTPHLEARWAHEFLDTSDALAARLPGATGASFTVENARVARDSAIVSGGVRVAVSERVQLFVDWRTELNAGFQSYGGVGGLRVRW